MGGDVLVAEHSSLETEALIEKHNRRGGEQREKPRRLVMLNEAPRLSTKAPHLTQKMEWTPASKDTHKGVFPTPEKGPGPDPYVTKHRRASSPMQS